MDNATKSFAHILVAKDTIQQVYRLPNARAMVTFRPETPFVVSTTGGDRAYYAIEVTGGITTIEAHLNAQEPRHAYEADILLRIAVHTDRSGNFDNADLALLDILLGFGGTPMQRSTAIIRKMMWDDHHLHTAEVNWRRRKLAQFCNRPDLAVDVEPIPVP
jgi:hypothetical protein